MLIPYTSITYPVMLELTVRCQTSIDADLVADGYWAEGYPCPMCGEVNDTDSAGEVFTCCHTECYDDHAVNSDEICHNCSTCHNCCECHCCSYCSEPFDSDDACSNCENCESHCPCYSCGRCDNRVAGDDFCGDCDRCVSCCHCNECAECSARAQCGECDRCYDCCYCENDDTEGIQSWNWMPQTIRFFANTESEVRRHGDSYPSSPDDEVYLGLEIETEAVDGGRHEIASAWNEADLGYCKSDGSLNDGVELITHPHTYQALVRRDLAGALQQVKKTGARSWDTRTCGLHIHVSRKAFAARSHQWRFCAAFGALEETIIKLAGRNTDELARRTGGTSYASWNNTVSPKPTKVIARKAYPRSRYVAINLENDGTIECRFWRGSLVPTTVLGAAAFTDALVRWTKDMTLREVRDHMTWDDFCSWAQTNLDLPQWDAIAALAAARRVTVPATSSRTVAA